MAEEIHISGKLYISSKRAAELSGYTQDYIGQLAREGDIDVQRIGGLWYINPDSIREHKKTADKYMPQPPKRHTPRELKSIISLEGKEYISAARASEITGYHADYVGHLARAEKVSSRQIGNRWYVDRKDLEMHKSEKDALLAAVQAESVGLKKTFFEVKKTEEKQEKLQTYFTYIPSDGKTLLPPIVEHTRYEILKTENAHKDSSGHRIPIYVHATDAQISLPRHMPISREIQNRKNVRVSGNTIRYASFTAVVFISISVFVIGMYSLVGGELTLSQYIVESSVIKDSMHTMLASAADAVESLAWAVEYYLVPELIYTSP